MALSISKNVSAYFTGFGSINALKNLLEDKKINTDSYVIYTIDHYFKNNDLLTKLPVEYKDEVIYVNSNEEVTTTKINQIIKHLKDINKDKPVAIVGIGGGSSLDTAKAVSNLLTNGGLAEEYQGWDLVKVPGIFKIGIPTLSGTGAESSRTCVMTNPENGLKLGMNSNHTIFDQLILDPELTKTVPKNQYFYTGMDTYFHCIESLKGRHRHSVSDAFSEQSVTECRKVFHSKDMMADDMRNYMMTASYLGGCAIANSFVGLIHPFSAGLSVVFKTPHGLANCIAMTALEEFYPEECKEFWDMVESQQVEIPRGICKDKSEEIYQLLYNSSIIHEKPLANALGDNFKEILTYEKVKDIFQKM